MMSYSFLHFGSFMVFKGLYLLASLTFLIGFIFFIGWGLTNIKKDKLLKTSIILIIVSVLVCLFTTAFGGFLSRYSKSSRAYYPGAMMNSGRWDYLKEKSKDTKDTKAATTTTTTDSKTSATKTETK